MRGGSDICMGHLKLGQVWIYIHKRIIVSISSHYVSCFITLQFLSSSSRSNSLALLAPFHEPVIHPPRKTHSNLVDETSRKIRRPDSHRPPQACANQDAQGVPRIVLPASETQSKECSLQPKGPQQGPMHEVEGV